jgi:hypothetical protein
MLNDVRVEASGDLRLSKEREACMRAIAMLAGVIFKVDIHGVFLNAVRDNPKEPYGINIVFVQKVKA